MRYNRLNNAAGWATGAVAYITYLKTMEPTASFWDCGEFLSCAAKLEVGHSPGAPLFMMLQRLFGIFAPSPVKMALFINSLSALTSALTIVFLFWTITHFASRILKPDANGKYTPSALWLIIGSGAVGALAYTFSDTFWFSAVEAEVYGTSSFFTAVTFWAVLRWERVADRPYADRWLVLIAYLVGLSLGVHLLNLLCIPPIVLIWYFRRYKPTLVGSIMAFFVGCAILGFVQIGIIQYIPKLAAAFDVFFTNSLGLPFDTGSVAFLVLLSGVLIGSLFMAKKSGRYLLHMGVLCVVFITIGYSSYIVPVIRSRANVPVDMTNPDNALSLNSYVSREQFGEQPLLTGPDFTSPIVEIKKTGPVYSQMKIDGKDHYEQTGTKREAVYDPATTRFFPRMWEGGEGHAAAYRAQTGMADGATPTTADNLHYFFSYQMGWMWWRYFMWNFAGRQNDTEGQGEPKNGNWISGIKWLDYARVGDIDKMSDGFRNNAARNELFFLPLILGILGIIIHFKKEPKHAAVVLLLFFFTGAAIGIFLNMYPAQPRERDYAFAGCTYAYAVWIGLGVLMLGEAVQRKAKGKVFAAATVGLCLVAVPVLMAVVEWDDHDRSMKTSARDTAWNTLQSCAPNAILVTFGDNDTYPLWYLQEVEGVRKDVRIMINTLIGTEWFIDQLQYKVNDADAVPMIWKKEDYAGIRREYVRCYNDGKVPQDKYYNLIDICKFITSTDPDNQLQNSAGDRENYFPAKHVFVPGLPREQLMSKGMLGAADTNAIMNEMKFDIPAGGLYKNDITLINMIAANAQNGWDRPIYFSGGFPGNDNYLGFGSYLRQEGMVYRLVPYSKAANNPGDKQAVQNIDLDKSYKLFMNTFLWGGANTGKVYFDEKNRNMLEAYRIYAARIANELSAKGRNAEAVQLLDKVVAGISTYSYYYDFTGYYMAEAYYHAGAQDKGHELALKIARNSEDDINWILTLADDQKEAQSHDIRTDVSLVNSLSNTAHLAGDEATAALLKTKFETMYNSVRQLVK